ncbi:hypothetical protein [Mesorhizobium sp. SP-1A]|uniref:hypothetical protein n=1 Tax=Mesorhizobium sp. SP-1A TaxID=3077840 RepID=UPI0028F6EEBA|nr:hypothetical protein [Mesorhizobium sp. SP-1A]
MESRVTSFFHDEKCLWHSGRPHALIFPIGGWVQPPNGSAYAESPDSKRRLKSLMDVSGLAAALKVNYSEAHVPFCGHALIEALAGHRMAVADPALPLIVQQQPGPEFVRLQKSILADLAKAAGLR